MSLFRIDLCSGGSIPGGGWEYFLLSTAFTSALCPTQPPIQWVPLVKRPGCVVKYSPASSAEIHLHSSIRLHGVVLR